jgi:hypothetical protein
LLHCADVWSLHPFRVHADATGIWQIQLQNVLG